MKDSIIQAQIERDLKKERLKGRIEEVEYLKRRSPQSPQLQKRLEKLRGELALLSD